MTDEIPEQKEPSDIFFNLINFEQSALSNTHYYVISSLIPYRLIILSKSEFLPLNIKMNLKRTYLANVNQIMDPVGMS